ncbi:hypothetical protein [Clostridium transplantifaecale]|uniref:hypothetical protein n=1 Tax=Clostridium transplantifaecale TaxID=2479838 RepID=UPI000F640A8F|nr:hypothetical protein [Clostridium transplantifaecale]
MNSQVPSGIFFSLLPHRKVMAGTKDSAKTAARPLACGLICPLSSMEEALVAATTFLRMPENYILFTMRLCKLITL